MATAATLQPTPAHQPPQTSSTENSTPTPSSTSHIISPPRGPVTAPLYFFSPPADGSAPFNYVEKPPEGVPQRNFGPIEHSVSIDDIRGREHQFSLDNDAFEALSSSAVSASKANLAPHSSSTGANDDDDDDDDVDFYNEDDIKTRYYAEVEKLLLDNLPGSHKIVIFDHTIRRANKNAPREPVLRVHIDQTPKSAAQRVRHHLPADEAEQLLQGRYRIVNVWRPLNGPVVSLPLAFASGRSARDADLVPVEHRYPDRTGETAAVKYSEGQKWYYWSGMRDGERLLLKCFDSDEGVGQWGRVPHTAFVDPRTKDDWPGRESIEVRALVFG